MSGGRLCQAQLIRVDPMNPAKLKHRGQIGVVESFDEDFQSSYAWMRCDDYNRLIQIELHDLVPAE